jgi:hypothetical protein
VAFRRIAALAAVPPDDQNQSDTAEDVDGVHAGHGEEDAAVDAVGRRQVAEQLDAEQIPLQAKDVPLQHDDHDEEQRAQRRRQQRAAQERLPVAVGRAHLGAVHEEAAEQQHRRGDQADDLAQLRPRVAPQHEARGKQRAEQKQLGEAKQPQAQPVGAHLLHGRKSMLNVNTVGVMGRAGRGGGRRRVGRVGNGGGDAH